MKINSINRNMKKAGEHKGKNVGITTTNMKTLVQIVNSGNNDNSSQKFGEKLLLLIVV